MENAEVKDQSKNGENGVKKANERICEIDEHITDRYEVKKRLGKGAYGIVYKAIDKKSNETVAIKKIFDAFRNQTDAQRTYREIFFLQAFRKHPNIIKLHSVHRAMNNKDIYLAFEYMQTDLHNVIKCGNILKDIHKQYIMYQLIKATNYIHSGNVIHRDQKPSNVLIDNSCRVKIADFGLARSVSNLDKFGNGGADPCLTDYVATRWYRAPEILIASKSYTKGVDMWSLGCILGEMINGKPLFPGTSTVNQLEKIMSCLPTPTPADISAVCTGYGSSLIRTVIKKRTPLRQLLINAPEEAANLICSLLIFNPTKRCSASEALRHSYVAKFNNHSNNEPILSGDVIPPLREDLRLSIDEYRNKIYGLTRRGPEKDFLSRKPPIGTVAETFTQSKIMTKTKSSSSIHSSGDVKAPSHAKTLQKLYASNLHVFNKNQRNATSNETEANKPKKRHPLFKNNSTECTVSKEKTTVNARSGFTRLKSNDTFVKNSISKEPILIDYSSI